MNTQITAPVARLPKTIEDTAPPKQRSKSRIAMTAVTIALCAGLLVLCFIGWRAGIFTSAETLQAFLGSMGLWAPVMFILLMVVQTVVAFIPGAVVCTVGVLAFGPVYGFIYNYLGLVLGSFIAFILARRFGRPLIQTLTSEKTYNKYIGWLDKSQSKFDKLFAVAIFMPFSPDDLLCMVAGVSKMKTSKFLAILLLCKPAFLIPYSLGLPWLTALLGG